MVKVYPGLNKLLAEVVEALGGNLQRRRRGYFPYLCDLFGLRCPFPSLARVSQGRKTGEKPAYSLP